MSPRRGLGVSILLETKFFDNQARRLTGLPYSHGKGPHRAGAAAWVGELRPRASLVYPSACVAIEQEAPFHSPILMSLMWPATSRPADSRGPHHICCVHRLPVSLVPDP
ncbi:hypothetical protein OG21DRAFT_165886 [Imleria badia]|nr:hypothetical protein OG21DRAFT_165886 [Imleria badia]